MSKYSDNPKIYQAEPPLGKPRQGGWQTTLGYLYQARKLSQAIIDNARLGQQYHWHCTINFAPVPVATIKHTWGIIAKRLRRRNIVALWVREPDNRNRCNYHLIVAQPINETELRSALKASLPDDAILTVKPIADLYALAHYVSKAKVGADDRHRHKRLLFAARLNKFGTIGKFWAKPKQQIWADVIEQERTISKRLDDVSIRRVAAYYYHLIDGAISLRTIQRNLAQYPDAIAPDVDTANQWWAIRFSADKLIGNKPMKLAEKPLAAVPFSG